MKNKGKQKKHILALFSLLLCIACITCGTAYASPADTTDAAVSNHYNVVLVVDGSGSMTWTDPEDWRFEAINQFVGLLSQQGNCLGAVVFDQEIQVQMDLSAINEKSDKKQITDAIQNYQVDKYGDTNIGLALKTAVDMIEQKGDKDLESVIVLLSDGNTDLSDEDALALSLEQKAQALDDARSKNIPIYTVCLNQDGSANISELKQLSDATGGVFEEVSRAEDLKNVFTTFLNLIYGSKTTSLIEPTQFGADGLIETDFEVPSVGVQEANVVINGSRVKGITLQKPDGSVVAQSALEDMITSSDSFTLIKIVSPDGGRWHISLEGDPGDTIQVDMVYNIDFKVLFSLQQSEDIPVNTEREFETTIYDGADALTGKDKYALFDAKLIVSDANGNTLDEVAMQPGDDSFSVKYSFDTMGTYYLSTSVEGQSLSQQTAPVMVNIGNTAPYLTGGDTLEQKVYLIPFKNSICELDLSGMAKDAEDASLTYKVVSTAFLAEDYELTESGKLTMKDYSVSKGSFTINAYDSMGAYCSFTVRIVTVNVGLWTLIGLGAAALIVAGVIVVLLMIALKKPFAGTCYAQSMVDGVYSQWSEVRRSRGRIKLQSFGIALPEGIQGTAYLQASGKNYVTLVSKKPFFCRGQMVKEQQVTSFDVEIRSSANSMDAMWIHFNGRMKR